ncbi:Hypothetical protein FKW44_007667 [Caligus rogercresseyi]|uniref:Uncharacterized protein n=1 Tax=Caligus rogercresseyi TaxID=217165 RepID=A0A7T8QTP9_CALRO|nr:Hypothetical protein FKW44_007667 [Caligus rogercresseyi]
MKLLLQVPWTRQSRRRSLSGNARPQQTNEGVLLTLRVSSVKVTIGNQCYSPGQPA